MNWFPTAAEVEADRRAASPTPCTSGGAPTNFAEKWRYLPGGTVVHAVGPDHRHATGLNADAECGYGPWDPCDWRGTGSQSEYETADRLPPCTRCLRAMGLNPAAYRN